MARIDSVTEEQLARKFHEVYERLAPTFGYETREDSAVPWEAVPEDNRELMIATARELIQWLKELPPIPRKKSSVKWWPDEVKCPHCKEVVPIEEDPECYMTDCPHCGGAVMVEPVGFRKVRR